MAESGFPVWIEAIQHHYKQYLYCRGNEGGRPSRFERWKIRRKRACQPNNSHKLRQNVVPNCGEDVFFFSFCYCFNSISGKKLHSFHWSTFATFALPNAIGQGYKSVPHAKFYSLSTDYKQVFNSFQNYLTEKLIWDRLTKMVNSKNRLWVKASFSVNMFRNLEGHLLVVLDCILLRLYGNWISVSLAFFYQIQMVMLMLLDTVRKSKSQFSISRRFQQWM